MSSAWRTISEGLRITIRLTPKGGCDALDGVAALANGTEVLKARVRAAPEDGAANAALRELLAKVLGTAKGDVELAAGHTARLKTIVITGDGPALAARLIAALKG